jgi:hypothetical protein
MIHLGASDFDYRDDWGTNPSTGTPWDHTQVFNNTIYLDGPGIDAMVAKEKLSAVQARGGDKGRCASVWRFVLRMSSH